MKPSANYAPQRQLVPRKKQVRLDLRRATAPSPENDLIGERKSTFWKWFGFVALFHVVALILFGLFYEMSPTPTHPQEIDLSLLPDGAVVKGTAGVQTAPKVGATTPAPSVAHPPPPPTPTPPVQPQPVKPPPVAVVKPPPVPTPKPVVVKTDTPLVTQDKPVTPPKPKIKVDLKLADGPSVPADKPVVKPKPHMRKPVATTATNETDDRSSAANSESHGLSKEQIAQELSSKLKLADAGVQEANRTGASGAENSHPNQFADFYASIRDQVMSKWEHPNQLDDSAVNPIVQIHVEKDGRVPPESVTLVKSSGSPVYDESALTAAKSLGYLLQPLPDGCPADIPITFKLTR